MWTIVAVYLAVIMLVHLPFVQRWLGEEVSGLIAAKLGTKAKVEKVRLGFLNRVVVDGFELYDQHGKLMLRAARLAAKIDYAELVGSGRVCVSSAQLFGMRGVFYKADAKTDANYQFVLDSLASKDKTKKSDLELSINSLIIRHGAVKFDRYDTAPTPSRLNPAHIDVRDISAHVEIPYYTEGVLEAKLRKLSLKEASGLELKRLKFNLSLNKGHAEVNGLELLLPATDLRISRLTAQYRENGNNAEGNRLYFKGKMDESKLTPCDLAFILPTLKRNTNPIYVTSSFSGTNNTIDINKLKLRSHDGQINLAATAKAAKAHGGTIWRADISHFECTAESVVKIINNSLDKEIKVSDMLSSLGKIKYKGSISGRGARISADGTLKSDIGRADIRADKKGATIDAHVSTGGIDIGRLLTDDKLGMMAAAVNVRCDIGKTGLDGIRVDGEFPRIDYNGYPYSGVKVNGAYSGGILSGKLSMDDPNGQISVEGTTELSQWLKSADITAMVRNLDPAALNLTKKWEGSEFDLDINANVHMDRSAATPFAGTVKVSGMSMRSPEREYRLDSLVMTAADGHMAIRGDFGHAEMTGRYQLRTLANSVANILNTKLPTLCKERTKSDNNFILDARITDSGMLDALFGASVSLGAPLEISAEVDDALGSLSLTCRTAKLYYDDSPYENITLKAGTAGGPLRVEGRLKKVMANGHRLDLGLSATADNDRMATTVSWNNHQEKLMAGTVNVETCFMKDAEGRTDVGIDVKPSEIMVNDTAWNILPANITYSGGNLAIEHFSIERTNQHIRVDGLATKQGSDSITVDMKDIDVSYLMGLINFHSVEFGGRMTGKAHVKSVFYEPVAHADLAIDHFTLEGGRLGKMYAMVDWNNTDKRIDIDAHAEEDNGSRTLVNGYVSPKDKDIDLGITADGTNIEFIESFCGTFMDNVEGRARGHLRLHGGLKALLLTGNVVADGSVRITPTNVAYRLENDTIGFEPDRIVFRSDTIRDRNGNIGIVDGQLRHSHLKNMTYDIEVKAANLLCYDTKAYDGDSYYGTAYATGLCTIRGRKGQVNIDVDVTPDRDSFIEYNVASPEAIADQQFITWRDKTAQATEKADTLQYADTAVATGSGEQQWSAEDIPSDIRINFIINMTPEAALRVLMDKDTNDMITLRGSGAVRASYFNKGSFEMFGTFVIDRGTYTLTIQNIIKKVFQFQNGSTIVFGGSPYNARLNLQAVYTVNSVPLSDLQLGSSFSGNNVRVDCLMNIGGTPRSPRIDFNIDMPTVSEDAEQMVRTVINSEEEMNQQVVYLLGFGRFYMQDNNNSSEQRQNQTSLAMQSLLSGTISQQINTLLGSLMKNNNWTFGANISTGDEGFNNAEYEGLLSGRLLDNRLIINGQFGYRDNENATTSFIGDFDISYLLTPNGNIALKVYNQTNDRYFTKSSLNTQGIGLMLKKDFNELMELFGYRRKRKTVSR